MPLKNSGRSVRVAAGFFLPGLVLLAYGWSLFNSPAFGSLADQPYHLALAQEYEQALRAGEFLPRWAAGLNGGRRRANLCRLSTNVFRADHGADQARGLPAGCIARRGAD